MPVYSNFIDNIDEGGHYLLHETGLPGLVSISCSVRVPDREVLAEHTVPRYGIRDRCRLGTVDRGGGCRR